MNRFSRLPRVAVAALLIAGLSSCGDGSRSGTVAANSLTATCDPAGTSSLTGFTTSAKKSVFTWQTSGSPTTFEFGRIGTTTSLETPTPKGALSLSAVVFDKSGRELGTATADCGGLVIEPPLPPATDVPVTIENQDLLNPTTVPTSPEVLPTAGPTCSAPVNLTPPTIIADPNSRTFLIIGSEGTWDSAPECGVVATIRQWERNTWGIWQFFGDATYVNTYCESATYPKYRLRVFASNNGGTTEALSESASGRC